MHRWPGIQRVIILDTNVLSESMRPPSPCLELCHGLPNNRRQNFKTSITEAEVLCGIELLTKGKGREVAGGCGVMFAEDLAGRVFVFESDAAQAFLHSTAGAGTVCLVI